MATVSAVFWWLASSPASHKPHDPAAGDGLPPQIKSMQECCLCRGRRHHGSLYRRRPEAFQQSHITPALPYSITPSIPEAVESRTSKPLRDREFASRSVVDRSSVRQVSSGKDAVPLRRPAFSYLRDKLSRGIRRRSRGDCNRRPTDKSCQRLRQFHEIPRLKRTSFGGDFARKSWRSSLLCCSPLLFWVYIDSIWTDASLPRHLR